MITKARLDKMERVYNSVIPGVMDSQELDDMRELIHEVRRLQVAGKKVWNALDILDDGPDESDVAYAVSLLTEARKEFREEIGDDRHS